MKFFIIFSIMAAIVGTVWWLGTHEVMAPVSDSQSVVVVYDGVPVASNITILDLSGRGLKGSLKAEVYHLDKLEVLNISNNNFTGVPAEVGRLSELRVLDLSNNPITGLPYEIGNLKKLERLDLRGTNYSEYDLHVISTQLPETTLIITDDSVIDETKDLLNEYPQEEDDAIILNPVAIQAIEDKKDLIEVEDLDIAQYVSSPLTITGKARGYWYFEGSFPVVLVDWDGRIIAEHFATAEGEWMTEDFVPFSTTIEFESPYKEGDPYFMAHGALILKRDNPSGLPENDDALEIPIRFNKQ